MQVKLAARHTAGLGGNHAGKCKTMQFSGNKECAYALAEAEKEITPSTVQRKRLHFRARLLRSVQSDDLCLFTCAEINTGSGSGQE